MPKRPSILHIDDDSVLQDVVGDVLAAAGMEVHKAGEITEGIHLALQKAPDLLLLDLHMPAGDGYEVCMAFRAVPELSHIPIVILTGVHDGEDAGKARECGATEYLTKPVDGARLIGVIRRLLEVE